MRRIAALWAVLALAACQTDPSAPGPSGGGALEQGCAGQGGRIEAGLAGPTCVTPEPDAGKTCSNSDECSGFCLAESRTCSPVTPYFGCHDLFENGQVAMLCVD